VNRKRGERDDGERSERRVRDEDEPKRMTDRQLAAATRSSVPSQAQAQQLHALMHQQPQPQQHMGQMQQPLRQQAIMQHNTLVSQQAAMNQQLQQLRQAHQTQLQQVQAQIHQQMSQVGGSGWIGEDWVGS
jgi:ABC-type Zn2+ transport system substrate-binding protein/surface adhesin